MLQVCLNGALSKSGYLGVPVSADELARDAAACVAAGAGSVHLHPRDPEGRERLDRDVVDNVVRVVRDTCGAPISVSTGAWIEPDRARRIDLISEWREPDFATVNVCEDGAGDAMDALLAAGVRIEAGIWSVEDVERLLATGFADRVARILVEPVDVAPVHAVEVVNAIHAALDSNETYAPRLQHGDGGATWILLRDAVQRGLDTRIGLEDTVHLPNGEQARDNAALVEAAYALGAR